MTPMVSSPGAGHSGRRPTPPRRAHLAVLTGATAGSLLLVCVRGTYFLTEFEANCSSEPDTDKPCLKSSDPAFSTYPIVIGAVACLLWLILLSIPARFVLARRLMAVLVVLGPFISVLMACDTASGYGFVP